MFIETESQLAKFCRQARAASTLFVDTEFIGEGRYYPQVGALQIAADGHMALIDPLAVRDLSPFLTLLEDPNTVKVFHAGAQDLGIFYRLLGRPLAPVFDTQIAAALLGYEDQISFGNLVERVTQVRLQKSHSFTDWLQRPLEPTQIEYALEDVQYLCPVYEHLCGELRDRGREAWAREEFSRLEEEARFLPLDPRLAFARLKGLDRLKGVELARVRELAAWREEIARDRNLNPGRICLDEVLLELARRPRETKEELLEVRGLRPRQVERFGQGLLDTLAKGVSEPYPQCKRARPLPTALEPTADFLMLCLCSLAANRGISLALLANRADTAAIALFGERAEVPLLRGWRREAVGEALLEALAGKATARVSPDTRQVLLDWHRPPGG